MHLSIFLSLKLDDLLGYILHGYDEFMMTVKHFTYNQKYSLQCGFYNSHFFKKIILLEMEHKRCKKQVEYNIFPQEIYHLKMRVKILIDASIIKIYSVLSFIKEGSATPGIWTEWRSISTPGEEGGRGRKCPWRKQMGLASQGILRGFIYRRSSVNRGVGVGEPQPNTLGPVAAGAVTTRACRDECSLRAEGGGCIPAEKQQALVKGHDQPEATSQREPRTKFPDLLPLFPLPIQICMYIF